jgi:hypothetical protein
MRTPSRPIFEPPNDGPVAANPKKQFPVNHSASHALARLQPLLAQHADDAPDFGQSVGEELLVTGTQIVESGLAVGGEDDAVFRALAPAVC